MFRLLWKLPEGHAELAGGEFGYDTQETAMASAKVLCTTAGGTVLVTQDIAEVTMAPAVTSLVSKPEVPETVYRGGLKSLAAPVSAPEPEGPQVEIVARDPRQAARPRLLIVDRKATPAELVGHLMVVAEGKIVKNAFGGLAADEMPLTSEEAVEVVNALRGNLSS